MIKVRKTGVALEVFRIVIMVLVVAFILFLALGIGTRKACLTKMVFKYIDNVEIDESYYDNFISAGFSEKQTGQILGGRQMKEIVAKVMSEQIVALFNNTTTYEYKEDECSSDIKNLIQENSKRSNLNLSENQINALTKYTLDISGITGMYIYESPAAYRKTVYQETEGKIDDYTSVFEVLATLNSPVFIITVFFMLMISILITLFIGEKDSNKVKKICNNITYPSFFLIGISIGYIFGASNGEVLTEYIFVMILISSIICFALGNIPMIFCLLSTHEGKENSGFDEWLSREKEKCREKEREKSGTTKKKRKRTISSH